MNLCALTRLGMPVTGDPVTELDDDLGRPADDLCACRARGARGDDRAKGSSDYPG